MDAETAAAVRQIIERAKFELANRFDLLHAAVRGEFMSILYSANLPSSKAQIDLDARLATVGKDAARLERIAARATTQRIYEQAGLTEDSGKDLIAFFNDIAKQIGRDAGSVSRFFRQVQVSMNQEVESKHAGLKVQALQHVNKPNMFIFRDKIGKVWDAKTYLRAHSSKYYYELANRLAIDSLRTQGLTNAVLNRPGHESDGLEVGLIDVDDKFKKHFLHPGSKGILT